MGLENGKFDKQGDNGIVKQNNEQLNSGDKNIKNINEQKEQIKQEERIDEIFGSLKGKKFQKGDIINFMYMAENSEKSNCSFNINNQTLEYKGSIYSIKLPNGAKLTNVEFNNSELIMKGKVGWFSGKGKASYAKMLDSLDNLFTNGKVLISTSNGNQIQMAKK